MRRQGACRRGERARAGEGRGEGHGARGGEEGMRGWGFMRRQGACRRGES